MGFWGPYLIEEDTPYSEYGTVCPHLPKRVEVTMLQKMTERPEEPMNWIERRTVKRLIMRVPMRVRVISEVPQYERAVESLNISIRGTYFPSGEKFRVGEEVEIRLRMPEVVVSGQKTEWRFTGRVTHVDKLGPYGKSGVGVYFLYYIAGNGLAENLSVE